MYVRLAIFGLILLERSRYNYYWKSIQPSIYITIAWISVNLNYIYFIYHENTIKND